MNDLDFTIEESSGQYEEMTCDQCGANAKVVGESWAVGDSDDVQEYWLLCSNCGYQKKTPSPPPAD